ncbi:MAG: peptidoglycan DD-metalloendopeptidase family protein [Burkholderiaceae bacterium]
MLSVFETSRSRVLSQVCLPGCGAFPSGAVRAVARIPLVFGFVAAVIAGCTSAPPAPIVARTSPAGGHLSASVPDRPAAPVVAARPSSGAPVQGSANHAAPAPASAAQAASSRPASPARPPSGAVTAATGPTAGPSETGVQTTPLASAAIESRALENRPPEARPLPSPALPATGGGVATPAERSAVDFAWPLPGRLLQSYGETGKGITLSGNAGDPVFAAAEGRVIFSGNGPRGYGNLIIVKHPNDLLSVYAHNRKLLVKEGQNVARGERIAELGDTGGSTPRLHFEIRRQGKPVDPLPMLPRR